MAKIQLNYVERENGTTLLEEDMTRLGFGHRVKWLCQKLAQLTEDTLGDLFNEWPLERNEGHWGSIQIGEYVVMAYRCVPPVYKRRLGAITLLTVAGVGTRAEILARLEDLASETDEPDDD
jgi:hypothetical protein